MNFWTNKRIWVTGGTGFLGKAVTAKLQEVGCQHIFATSRKDGNLTDPVIIKKLLAELRPNLVIHLAAVVGGIGANRDHPAEFYYQNLVMGTHLLHESWKAGIEKFVAIGTICAYPKFTSVPFKEEDLWNGYPEETNAPYGLAKKMLLVQAQAYRKQYGFNAIYLLPINLYGPGDNFDPKSSHVIPALIKKIIEAKTNGEDHITAWGDGSATRGFLYIKDAAEGIVLATQYYNKELPVNIGSPMEISIKELTRMIARLVDYKGEILWDLDKPNGQPRRCLDVSRAQKEFHFLAHTDFQEGLKKTIQWYLTHSNQKNSQKLSA